jgi:hypothetical protein
MPEIISPSSRLVYRGTLATNRDVRPNRTPNQTIVAFGNYPPCNSRFPQRISNGLHREKLRRIIHSVVEAVLSSGPSPFDYTKRRMVLERPARLGGALPTPVRSVVVTMAAIRLAPIECPRPLRH